MLSTSRAGLDRSVALAIDLVLNLELEARVVGVVVAAATDLQDHTGVALIAEGQDRPHAHRVLSDVIAARTVAGFTAHGCEIRIGRAFGREATGL